MNINYLRDNNIWGIFFLSLGTLLYEVVLTSIFSYIVWSNYAFLIVSTALFGFGIAGVFLHLFQGFNSPKGIGRRISILALLFALSAVFSLQVIILVPLDVSSFDQFLDWVFLFIIFLAIIIPFFFSGLAISILLSSDKEKVNKLYFFDLIGASLGSLAIIAFITPLGASGTLLAASALGILSALIFLKGHKAAGMKFLLLFILVGVGILIPFSESIFPIYPHQNKRNFTKKLKNMEHFFSGWSSLSKIDVVGKKKNGNLRAQIWINGGQNQSFLAGIGPYGIGRPRWGESYNFPYMFMRDKKPKVLIIGSSGGMEVYCALSHHSARVDAVEMDPLICKVVKKDFRKHNGDLFNRPEVHLINDEGRSFVLHTDHKYDLIQMKNNFTPIAIASGAINLSETYLLTEEGFRDYITDLTPDGILALNRWGSIRLCTTLRKAFNSLGRKNVWKHVIVLTGETWMANGFYFRNTPFTKQDILWAQEYAKVKHFRILYHPEMAENENLYARVLKGDNPEAFYSFIGFDLTPPTDNRPFFNHFVKTGGKAIGKNQSIPNELKRIYQLFSWRPWKKAGQVVSKSDMPIFSLAIESLIVSIFFIFLPLFLRRNDNHEQRRKWPYIYYFSMLGLGFIMIELCLMKQFVLFLGYPALSISLIISVLLFFSGVWSFIAERFRKNEIFWLRIIFVLIFLVNMLFITVLPRIFLFFLGSSFTIRVMVTILILIPIGIVMGMPFPLGLRLVHGYSKGLVGWVWGINGFATVIGSVLMVIIALYYGFDSVFYLACLLYLSNVFIVGKLRNGK